MNKNLLAVGLLIVSVAAFFMWVNPQYAIVKTSTAELNDSKSALAQAQELDSVRSQLSDKENSFSQEDMAKLQKMLPDSVDSVRFIIDMQSIAARQGLAVQDIAVNDVGSASAASSATALGPSGKPYSETQLGFSITTTYEKLLSFLGDLEKNLRLVEIKSLSFTADDVHPNIYKVSMTLSTFWLNK